MLEVPDHSRAFRIRRFLNWFPLGLAYAFLYMGRYNLTVAKNALGELMSKAEFGEIFGVGAAVYGISFVVNGPLTDRIGGRRTMLVGVAGALAANAAMGLVLYGIQHWGWQLPILWTFMVLYALNMYFQSFGAVSIVTVKAPWFHVGERGGFSTLFGAMISLGIYFAFDWGYALVKATRAEVDGSVPWFGRSMRVLLGFGGRGVDENWWLFFVPAAFLGLLWGVLFLYLRDRPSHAGFEDFDTGEESVGDDGEEDAPLPIKEVFFRILTHPVLSVICFIEFCSGILRNGVMHWYPFFAKETGFYDDFFVTRNWGLMLLLAGIIGAALTGWASDRFFGSRRAPMAAVLYAVMLLATGVMSLSLEGHPWLLGGATLAISMAVIGVHGIMSGTSTVDFGGSKNGGAAVGIVDGLVYLGTAIQSLAAGFMTPAGAAAKDPGNWLGWPAFLVPFALLGLLASLRIWHALPRRHVPEPSPSN